MADRVAEVLAGTEGGGTGPEKKAAGDDLPDHGNGVDAGLLLAGRQLLTRELA